MMLHQNLNGGLEANMGKRHLRYDWTFNCWWIVGKDLHYWDAMVL